MFGFNVKFIHLSCSCIRFIFVFFSSFVSFGQKLLLFPFINSDQHFRFGMMQIVAIPITHVRMHIHQICFTILWLFPLKYVPKLYFFYCQCEDTVQLNLNCLSQNFVAKYFIFKSIVDSKILFENIHRKIGKFIRMQRTVWIQLFMMCGQFSSLHRQIQKSPKNYLSAENKRRNYRNYYFDVKSPENRVQFLLITWPKFIQTPIKKRT